MNDQQSKSQWTAVYESDTIWIHAPGQVGAAKIEAVDYDDGLGARFTNEDHANAALFISAEELRKTLEDVTANLMASMTDPMRKRVTSVIAKSRAVSSVNYAPQLVLTA